MSKEITSPQELISILERQCIGHLGCYANGEVYVVPITYAFDDGCIYSHSTNGKKIEMMRNNPKICIQMEEVRGLFEWNSVITWGDYEELKGENAARGMRLLIKSIAKHEHADNIPSLEMDFTEILETAIIFRVKIKKSSGRHEGAV